MGRPTLVSKRKASTAIVASELWWTLNVTVVAYSIIILSSPRWHCHPEPLKDVGDANKFVSSASGNAPLVI